jgi:hypothetical protein
MKLTAKIRQFKGKKLDTFEKVRAELIAAPSLNWQVRLYRSLLLYRDWLIAGFFQTCDPSRPLLPKMKIPRT